MIVSVDDDGDRWDYVELILAAKIDDMLAETIFLKPDEFQIFCRDRCINFQPA